MTDKECAEKMREILKCGGDEEVWHAKADGLLCELLEELGYVETIRAYDEIPMWYA